MERSYAVPGISCQHCKQAIEAEVGVVPGVAGVLVDVVSRTVSVSGSASDEAIRSAIGEAGYAVRD